jgi:hypothetical protein
MRILLAFLFLSLPLAAQEKRWLVTGGGAVGSVGAESEAGLGGLLSVSYNSPKGIFSLRTSGMGAVSFHSSPVPSAYDIGGLYGAAFRSASAVLTASTGISLVMVRQAVADTEFRHRPTVGIPFEVQLAFPSPELDIGFTVYGNLNAEAVFYGAGVIVRVGG